MQKTPCAVHITANSCLLRRGRLPRSQVEQQTPWDRLAISLAWTLCQSLRTAAEMEATMTAAMETGVTGRPLRLLLAPCSAGVGGPAGCRAGTGGSSRSRGPGRRIATEQAGVWRGLRRRQGARRALTKSLARPLALPASAGQPGAVPARVAAAGAGALGAQS